MNIHDPRTRGAIVRTVQTLVEFGARQNIIIHLFSHEIAREDIPKSFLVNIINTLGGVIKNGQLRSDIAKFMSGRENAYSANLLLTAYDQSKLYTDCYRDQLLIAYAHYLRIKPPLVRTISFDDAFFLTDHEFQFRRIKCPHCGYLRYDPIRSPVFMCSICHTHKRILKAHAKVVESIPKSA